MPFLDNLISYWKLDEIPGPRADSHGANTLTDNNTVARSTGRLGDGGAQFVAANSESLTRADNAGLSLGASSLTLTAWILMGDKAAAAFIAGKHSGGAATDAEYNLRYEQGVDRFQFRVYHGGSAAIVQADALGSPVLSTWYFIVCWYEHGVGLNLQINNGAVNTTAAVITPNDTTTPFALGASGSATLFYSGIIDEVGLWKRVLTPAERTYLYNGGLGLAYPFPIAPIELLAAPLPATALLHPATVGIGSIVSAGTLTASVATAPAATYRPGTAITIPTVVAAEATLLPYARTGSVAMSIPRMVATATTTSLGLVRSAELRAQPLAATAVFSEIGGTGRGATFSAEVMTAEARGVACVPWVTIGRGVRTVLALPRRLTVLARAGGERGE